MPLTTRQAKFFGRLLKARGRAGQLAKPHFLLLSRGGEGCAMLNRIKAEGNDVTAYILEDTYRDAWDGLLPKTKDWKKALRPNTVVFTDATGLGKEADQIRKAGYPVFAGCAFADQLEQDRDFGLELMRKCGIQVPDTESFTEFAKAREFLGEHSDKRYVFKPSGKAVPTKLTYVPDDGEDLLSYLDFVEKRYAKKIEGFDLQEFVEGALVSTEIWCDGKKIVPPYNHTVEAKALMNDNLGPATGCSGNLVWVENDERCPIVAEGVARAGDELVREGYAGMMDLNTIVNEQGVWGLEWTPRNGYDAICALLPMLDGDLGQLISDFASGQAPDEFPFKYRYGAAIRLGIPPYPTESATPNIDTEKVEPNLGVLVRGVDPDDLNSHYLYEVKIDPELGQLVHSGGTGVILAATHAADRIEPVLDIPYETLKSVKVPNKMYRTDLKKVLLEMYRKVARAEKSTKRAA